MASAGLALPVSCILAFLSGATGVFLIQKLLDRDSFTQALGKALIAGILSGIPSSIAGTIFGGWVIAVAGLGKKDDPVEEPPIDDQASSPKTRAAHPTEPRAPRPARPSRRRDPSAASSP